MKDKISVCMASFNGERFIKNQMASILCQLNEYDEVIVVDDKSTDGTIQILKNFNDDRIKINCNSQNMGSNASFQKALSLATGRYIFLSDQDDVWYTNKVQICLKYLKEHNLDLIVHDARVINILKNSVISESLFDLYKSSPGLIRNLISSRHTGCCMVMTQETLNKVMPIPQVRGVQHDAWIGTLTGVFRLNKIFLSHALIDYNRHELNVSPLKRNRHLFPVIVDRCFLITCLALRVLTGGFKHIRIMR